MSGYDYEIYYDYYLAWLQLRMIMSVTKYGRAWLWVNMSSTMNEYDFDYEWV